MPTEPLPTFKYHPDPIATGSVVQSQKACACCKRNRGYMYAGPVFSEEDYDDLICPWCIADGSAHRNLGVTFHDEAAVPGADFLDAPPVSEEIVDEVCGRTPGFSGWQQEQWFTCCDDAAAFLGKVGHKELKALGPKAIAAAQDASGLDDEEWEEFFESLDREGSPTAYLFKCLHCGKYGAYQDCD